MTKRRTRGRLGEAGVTEGMYHYFAHGAYFPEATEFEATTTEAERRTLWTRHRTAILARFMVELQRRGKWFVGRRPRYFWREIEEQGHTRRQVGVHEWWGPWERGGQKLRKTPVVENDWQFLNRLGLLEEWEREAGDPDGGQGKFA